jgi:hypothetical protein
MLSRFYASFNIAGFTYYDGVDVFKDLQIGTELRLAPEPENKFDEHAVAIYYNDHQLGYIPKNRNTDIGKFLNFGHTNLFEIKINRIALEERPEEQIGVVVKIKNNKTP